MPAQPPGGVLTLADDLSLSRMGFGAMQLSGPGIFGPSKDRDECIAVLRTAVDLGVTHIDTSDFYGPTVTNEIIREALHPYPADLRIVTKVGARRGADASWNPSHSPADLTAQVHENLEHLGLDVLDVVNLRISMEAGDDEPVEDQFAVLAGLQQQGLIRHLGLSGATDAWLTGCQAMAPVVTVQNMYNVAVRADEAMVDRCEREGISYAPFFPLGGFTPLQHDGLDKVAADLSATPQQVALAWLFQRSSTMTLIPGTSSVAHLRENIAAVDLVLPADSLAELDGVGSTDPAPSH